MTSQKISNPEQVQSRNLQLFSGQSSKKPFNSQLGEIDFKSQPRRALHTYRVPHKLEV